MEIIANDMFLTDEEVARLTGRTWPSLQKEQLLKERIPFHINALGRPIVLREVLSGSKQISPLSVGWSSNKRS